MISHRPRGFTLIELLVVIAIIGILSSVVLASLNTARDKGVDAAVKADLDGVRSQAALFYDGDGLSYADVCGTDDSTDGVASINHMILAAAQKTGLSAISVNEAGADGQATCNAGAEAWAAEAPLKTSGFYCVDSTGFGGQTASSSLADGSDVACN
jgi:prepilin-type N-terminal cleavage/methylation domain-containing protein